jgi:glutaminase
LTQPPNSPRSLTRRKKRLTLSLAGGIVAVSPGKGGFGAFAPRLDEASNSVKGQLAARFLSERLGFSLFASTAEA